jgi:hypothetical protein
MTSTSAKRLALDHLTAMGPASNDILEDHTACARFFSVDELVSEFLYGAETQVLVNCQRVCQLWKSIIDQSQILQENLFSRLGRR